MVPEREHHPEKPGATDKIAAMPGSEARSERKGETALDLHSSLFRRRRPQMRGEASHTGNVGTSEAQASPDARGNQSMRGRTESRIRGLKAACRLPPD